MLGSLSQARRRIGKRRSSSRVPRERFVPRSGPAMLYQARLAKSERVSGVGERPATNPRREIFAGFGVATVKGTPAIGVARLFAEPCRSDGLGRSARHITGLLPWVRRAGDNECPLVRRGGERTSAHAKNACAPGSGRQRRNQSAKASGTRPSLGPGAPAHVRRLEREATSSTVSTSGKPAHAGGTEGGAEEKTDERARLTARKRV